MSCGVDLIDLPSSDLPDSVFIEDTAVVVSKKVLITNMGAEQRRPESHEVRRYFKSLETLDIVDMPETARLDGGDVLFTGKEIFVGLSNRTDIDGINFLRETFSNLIVHEIDIRSFSSSLHLKSACSACGDGRILVGGEVGKFIEKEIIKKSKNKYEFFYSPDMAAANCMFVNDVLIRRHADEFPSSQEFFAAVDRRVIEQGGTVVVIKADELAKVDGALTCCSLLVDLE